MIEARETFGNVPTASRIAFYALAIAAMGIFAVGVWRRFRLWRQGQGSNGNGDVGWRKWLPPLTEGRALRFGESPNGMHDGDSCDSSLRPEVHDVNPRGSSLRVGGESIFRLLQPGLRRLLIEGFGQRRVRGRGLTSGAHLLLFAGFMILLLGTTLLEVDHLAAMVSEHLKFHRGIYYVLYEFVLDLAGLLFLGGCLFFLGRRLWKPASVGHRATDWFVLGSFLGIGITGYFVEGLRIAWQKPSDLGLHCSPVGLWISWAFTGLTETQARSVHLGVWWIHSLLVFGFIAAIPYTRLLHILAAPLNLLLARPAPGAIEPVTLEEVEQTGRVGVSDIRHFTGQQLLSFDACMECGRCEEACPAFASGKPLSPKKLVQDLKTLMGGLAVPALSSPSRGVHETIAAETAWACTSCGACTGVCPVRVDPLTLVFDLRRHLAAEGGLSGSPASALRRMHSSGNPWGLPGADRADWTRALAGDPEDLSARRGIPFRVPTAKENPDFEILYWVGCAGSFDRRAQRVSRAVAKLMHAAGVNFAILGSEERCTGESARRLGDEFLFQELAQANIATLAKYKVTKIVSHCPHCVNSFRNDYPPFGGNYETMHHSELLALLVRDGRLRVSGEVPASLLGPTTYHDPCYLARANGIHSAPREVLAGALRGGSQEGIREMPRCREKTSCCGAGGGRSWMEEEPSRRVSTLRSREALETGAQTVAVGCPFCLTMMTDGVSANGGEARVADIAEILAERMGL